MRIQGSIAIMDPSWIYQEAEICQREKCGLPGSQDNFFARLFYARNKVHAAQVLKKIRGEMGLK